MLGVGGGGQPGLAPVPVKVTASSMTTHSVRGSDGLCWLSMLMQSQASSVGGSEDVICLLGPVHLDHMQQYCVLFEGLGFELGIDSRGRNRELGHPADC